MRNVPESQIGYTLIEMLLVVGLLALVAAIAAPAFNSNEEVVLDRAAADVASAFRFARSEAIRTGEGHGLTISQVTQEVTAEKYDINVAPIVTLNTLTDPITKQPYDFNINTSNGTKGVLISNSVDIFNYGTEGRRRSLIFDRNGAPIWIVGADPTRHLLVDATVELSIGGQQRLVDVAPMTGRVTIQ